MLSSCGLPCPEQDSLRGIGLSAFGLSAVPLSPESFLSPEFSLHFCCFNENGTTELRFSPIRAEDLRTEGCRRRSSPVHGAGSASGYPVSTGGVQP